MEELEDGLGDGADLLLDVVLVVEGVVALVGGLGAEPEEEESTMEQQTRFSIWYVFLAFWVVLILHQFIQASLIQDVTYSEFLAALCR